MDTVSDVNWLCEDLGVAMIVPFMGGVWFDTDNPIGRRGDDILSEFGSTSSCFIIPISCFITPISCFIIPSSNFIAVSSILVVQVDVFNMLG